MAKTMLTENQSFFALAFVFILIDLIAAILAFILVYYVQSVEK